jgi:hypothetical protein
LHSKNEGAKIMKKEILRMIFKKIFLIKKKPFSQKWERALDKVFILKQ